MTSLAAYVPHKANSARKRTQGVPVSSNEQFLHLTFDCRDKRASPYNWLEKLQNGVKTSPDESSPSLVSTSDDTLLLRGSHVIQVSAEQKAKDINPRAFLLPSLKALANTSPGNRPIKQWLNGLCSGAELDMSLSTTATGYRHVFDMPWTTTTVIDDCLLSETEQDEDKENIPPLNMLPALRRTPIMYSVRQPPSRMLRSPGIRSTARPYNNVSKHQEYFSTPAKRPKLQHYSPHEISEAPRGLRETCYSPDISKAGPNDMTLHHSRNGTTNSVDHDYLIPAFQRLSSHGLGPVTIPLSPGVSIRRKGRRQRLNSQTCKAALAGDDIMSADTVELNCKPRHMSQTTGQDLGKDVQKPDMTSTPAFMDDSYPVQFSFEVN